MSLSEEDRRVLAELGAQFERADPRLARKLAMNGGLTAGMPWFLASVLAIVAVVGVVLVVTGLTLGDGIATTIGGCAAVLAVGTAVAMRMAHLVRSRSVPSKDQEPVS